MNGFCCLKYWRDNYEKEIDLKKVLFLFFIFILTGGGTWGTRLLYAQSFGFDDEETVTAGLGAVTGALKVSVNGEASTSVIGYIDDFKEGASEVKFGDLFSGGIGFSAETSYAQGVIKLKLKPSENPVEINEAYLRGFFGRLEIEAGMRKLSWGKADSFGPLDIINPIDSSEIYTEMADNNSLMGVKIARPLIHASFRFRQFSKIECVFIPNFEPVRFAADGRWAPKPPPFQKKIMEQASMMGFDLDSGFELSSPETDAIDYAQAGLRFTTTIGSSDIGAQYYYGRLTQPAIKINILEQSAEYLYNPYHQIGIDYATVLLGFNIRAEFAANITEDLKGDDGSVYNPSLAWSFGFDRDLFWGININLQVNESIRLLNGKVLSTDILTESFDIEDGMSVTTTRITATVSKKFLRDTLEFRTAVVWGIEDSDCAVMPALIWTKDDMRLAFSCGFFAGDSDGQLGQYRDNTFLKLTFAYSF